MEPCGCQPNRTAPLGDEAVPRADLPLCSRTNGWSWPPHPFQLLAWLLYTYFAVVGFGVFVPLLPTYWIPAGYICTAAMFVCHLGVHLTAVSIDPADSNVRAKSYRGPVPTFDRTKHAHVIENCHCYLCEVDVSPKSKHCSACNKCVASFDHHCRWLNNCVGSRNYSLFLYSVLSALLGVCLVVLYATYVFIEFFLDPAMLRSDKHFEANNETEVWFVFLPVAPVSTAGAAIPALAGITVAMGLLSALLLGHLLCFHIYLMWNRLSTYEYIVRQRHRQDPKGSIKGSSHSDSEPSKSDLTNVQNLHLTPRDQDVSYSGTLGYTNTKVDMEDSVSIATGAGPEFYSNGRLRTSSTRASEDQLPPVSAKRRPNNTQNRTQKKKKKKVRKVRAEAADHSSRQGPVATVESDSRVDLPLQAFPVRTSLLPLAPVRAAGPPAEYHSDSAESLEEIPVALAQLGSAPPAGQKPPRAIRCASAFERAPPPAGPQRRDKRKVTLRRPAEEELEMVSREPSVFVSRSSGEGPSSRTATPSL